MVAENHLPKVLKVPFLALEICQIPSDSISQPHESSTSSAWHYTFWLFINSQPGMVIDETGRKKGRQEGRTWDFSEYSYGNAADILVIAIHDPWLYPKHYFHVISVFTLWWTNIAMENHHF